MFYARFITPTGRHQSPAPALLQPVLTHTTLTPLPTMVLLLPLLLLSAGVPSHVPLCVACSPAHGTTPCRGATRLLQVLNGLWAQLWESTATLSARLLDGIMTTRKLLKGGGSFASLCRTHGLLN